MSYPYLRDAFAEQLGPGAFPQVVFRLGIPERTKASAPAARRDLAFESYL